MQGTANSTPASLARRATRLREVILETVSEDDMTAIVKKLIDVAKEGDLSAIRLLFRYTLGKPTEASPTDAAPRGAAGGSALDVLDQLIPASAKLDEMIREEQRRAAPDTKRPKTAGGASMSVPSGQRVAATESMRLVTGS